MELHILKRDDKLIFKSGYAAAKPIAVIEFVKCNDKRPWKLTTKDGKETQYKTKESAFEAFGKLLYNYIGSIKL